MFDARPTAARRRFPVWFLALGLLLGLNLLVLLYVLLRDERAAAARTVAVPVTVPAATAVAAPPAVPAVPVARPAVPAPPSSPPARSTASTDMPTAAPVAVPAAAPTATPQVRTRDDLLAAGAAVPETQVSLHVYDADPAKRFVFLNGQRLREGDVAANGLRVERIDADGVVLDHRGNDFKVPLEP